MREQGRGQKSPNKATSKHEKLLGAFDIGLERISCFRGEYSLKSQNRKALQFPPTQVRRSIPVPTLQCNSLSKWIAILTPGYFFANILKTFSYVAASAVKRCNRTYTGPSGKILVYTVAYLTQSLAGLIKELAGLIKEYIASSSLFGASRTAITGSEPRLDPADKTGGASANHSDLPPSAGSIQIEERMRERAKRLILMVGAEGFEPPTLCSQSRCATRLRYAPTPFRLYRRRIQRVVSQPTSRLTAGA